MQIVAIFFGFVVGAAQFRLLSAVTALLMSGKKTGRIILFVMGKLALYAAALWGTVMLAPAYLIWVGAGLAAGLILAAVARYVQSRRSERKKEGGDNPS